MDGPQSSKPGERGVCVAGEKERNADGRMVVVGLLMDTL